MLSIAKKDMIIASGFKVWPRDVEDVIYQHPRGSGSSCGRHRRRILG